MKKFHPRQIATLMAAFLLAVNVSQAQVNNLPSFDEPELSQWQAEIMQRNSDITANPESYFSVDNSVCELSEEARWIMTHGRPEADVRALHDFQESAIGMKTTVTLGEVKLVEGECNNGLPEGEFIAVGSHTTQTSMANGGGQTLKVRSWMKSSIREGRLQGRMDFIMEMQFDMGGTAMTSYFQTVGNFDGGRENGPHLVMTIMPNMVTTLVHRHKPVSYGSHLQSKMYQGANLVVEGSSINGLPHGWSRHPGGKRTCWELGEIADAERCQLQAPPASLMGQLSDEELAELVRHDNQGEFISPYTSDGVMAEWVNQAVLVNIGAAMGSSLGAAAGAAAGVALDFVPYGMGRVLASYIGSEIGKRVGREAAITAAGGWDAIRGTSDRSFDSAEAMAHYLVGKYGDAPTYSEAVRVTTDLYPELKSVLKSAY